MTKPRQDHDDIRDDHANDNGHEDRVVAATPAAGALTSLAALEKAFATVDLTAAGGRSGRPMLLFKAREGNGTYSYGKRRTIPEDGSRWGVDPRTFEWGWIAFSDTNQRLGERLVSISKPLPDPTELPDKGVPWKPEWSVGMKCLDGADAGVEVDFKATTDGAIQAVTALIEEIRDRFSGGQHDGKIVPIVRLRTDFYSHGQFGRTNTPVLTIDGWMTLDGPAPAPEPASPPASPSPPEQPRRRRVA